MHLKDREVSWGCGNLLPEERRAGNRKSLSPPRSRPLAQVKNDFAHLLPDEEGQYSPKGSWVNPSPRSRWVLLAWRIISTLYQSRDPTWMVRGGLSISSIQLPVLEFAPLIIAKCS